MLLVTIGVDEDTPSHCTDVTDPLCWVTTTMAVVGSVPMTTELAGGPSVQFVQLPLAVYLFVALPG